MSYRKVLLFISIFLIEIVCSTENNASSPVLFTLVGQAALKTAYGHLVIPLNIPDIKRSFDEFEDLEKAINQLTTGTDAMYSHRNSEANNLKGKLNILHHLALQRSKDSAFDKVNDLNEFKDQLVRTLGDKASEWKPPTPAPSTDATTNSPRGKRDVISAGSLFQLAGFALSLFNKRELSNIKRAAEATEGHQRYVAAKAEESLLRLSNLTAYTKGVYDTTMGIAKTQTDLYREIKRVGLETEIAQMKRIFLSEFSLFLTGIQSLIEGHFSPLFVNPDLLQSTYDDIVNKARSESLNPVSNDADTLFQSPTSVIGTNDGDLLIIVHIPLYSGSLMRLYRYVAAPFPLRDNIVATIRHGKEYLALDPSGTVGKELSATEILKCDRINRIHHCNGENVLQKNLERLCLYNLYHQRVDEIEDFCNVEIGKVKSHAIQLSGNQFRILVTEPTQLTWICHDGSSKVETISGVYILTLTEACSKANTPDHVFNRNPHVVSSQQLIALTLIQKAERWFQTIEQRFKGIDLEPIFEELQLETEGPISIQQFRHRIETDTKKFYVTIIDYVQLTLTGIATLYLVYLLIGFLRKYVFPKVPFCCKPCKKSSRVKQYRVVTRQPKQFKPSRKAKNLISEELLKVQPSAPVSNINPV